MAVPIAWYTDLDIGDGHADKLGRIRVGPQSAGANPGPACYGQGGNAATITDANLMLGRLDPLNFAGGSIRLETNAASQAIEKSISKPIGLSANEAAKGIIEIVDEHMSAAARVHAVERGKEVTERTMIAFGGGAPLHAAYLAEKLGINRIIVPANAGVGSALGFLLAPVAYEVVRSRYMRLETFEGPLLNSLFLEMSQEAANIVRLGNTHAALEEKRHGYARYVGQGHEIKIDLPSGNYTPETAEVIKTTFEYEYEKQYARTVPGLDIEILTWSVLVSSRQKPIKMLPKVCGINTMLESERTRILQAPDKEMLTNAKVFARESFKPGLQVAGPAIIIQDDSTLVVLSGQQIRVDEIDLLHLTENSVT